MLATREAEIALALAGQLACEALNFALKRLIKEERPRRIHGKGYGMPSSHAQFVAFWSVSLALFLLSVAAAAVILVLFVLWEAWRIDAGLDPYLLSSIVFIAALAVFAAALRYDISDPRRVTPRSDTAFWLHMAAAPGLFYAMLGLITGGEAFWLSGEGDLGRAAAVVLLVAFLMTIGLVIDRRAFVTSGLLSLGGAIWVILNEAGVSFDTYVFVVFAAVGLTVLVIGIFWQALRRVVMRLLPDAVTTRLPATR